MNVRELAKTHNWNLPVVCPACGSELVLDENHTHLTCTNEFCSSRISGNISKWTEKLKIKELGLTTIELIQSMGYFQTISGIYKDLLNPECNTKLSAVLGKNWDNIKTEINSHKEASLAQFISGYNIAGLGEKQVQKIIQAKNWSKLSDFMVESPNEYECEGIGSIIANKLFEGMKRNYSDMVETFKFVTIKVEEVISGGKLGGKSFCFTGKSCKPRKELQAMVISNGGINKDGVTAGLSYLVTDDTESGSSKNQKAKKLGIPVITSNEFLAMCE